jgi:hypothetical protein
VNLLFDAHTAPADTLDWLACWFDLALEPQWDEARRRFLIANADRFFRIRGTSRGMQATLRLYLDCDIGEEIFEPPVNGMSSGRVRVVERFLTRSTSTALVERTEVQSTAHRFDVMVPHDLTTDQLAMVDRLVKLNRPAHTLFEVQSYWAYFRVGLARVGLDTQLGESARFAETVLGETDLPDGYLPSRYPLDVTDRVVVGRDRLGDFGSL